MKRPYVVALCLALAACGEEEIIQGGSDQPSSPQAKPAATATGTARGKGKGPDGKAAPAEEAEAKVLQPREYDETDFVESEDSRDPFREFSQLFVRRARTQSSEIQRKIKASQFALDELKLSGIISRGRPAVMLTDPSGFGWILYTGDFVGKPELIATGGTDGQEVAINWRVDRIRDTDVVFIREDSAHPDIPPTTRVIPLYPTGDEG
jgi:type IV pilus assembly protein PilP